MFDGDACDINMIIAMNYVVNNLQILFIQNGIGVLECRPAGIWKLIAQKKESIYPKFFEGCP